jgi:hypothetical protein
MAPRLYLADIFTNATNLAGICGVSLPCGFAQMDGHRLPIGLQLLGKALEEARILQIAHAYERSTDWHKARPDLWLSHSVSRRPFADHPIAGWLIVDPRMLWMSSPENAPKNSG